MLDDSNYIILDKLGEGDGGIVSRARDSSNDQLVAIKECANSSELGIHIRMNHIPNVVKLYDYFDNYLVMELIDGLQLSEHTYLYKSWQYNWVILRYLLGVMLQLHQYEFCHGDLKADNIMIRNSDNELSDRIVLIDLQNSSPVNNDCISNDIILISNIFEYIYPDDGYINDDNGLDRYLLLREYVELLNSSGLLNNNPLACETLIMREYDKINAVQFTQ